MIRARLSTGSVAKVTTTNVDSAAAIDQVKARVTGSTQMCSMRGTVLASDGLTVSADALVYKTEAIL